MISERLAIDLDRMLDAARSAANFTSGMSEGDFLADAKTQAAVMMCFIIIGEAAKRIADSDPSFVENHADWPWPEMRGIRNRGAHSYETIDFPLLWAIITTSIPILIERIEAMGNLDPRQAPPHSGS